VARSSTPRRSPGPPGVDGRTARWAGHREQRRLEFVDAAVAVIELHGPGATVDTIARHLGLTRQALYRQFDDRADLDRAIAERAATLLVEDLMPHLALASGPGSDLDGDIDASIRAALVAYLVWVESHRQLYRFVRAHDAELDTPTTGSAVRRVKDTVATRVADIARDHLVATGTAPVALATSLATGLIGMVDAVVGRWVDDPGGLERDDVVEHLVVMLSGAIRALL
jgi:AcrR family transcriptional regulator